MLNDVVWRLYQTNDRATFSPQLVTKIPQRSAQCRPHKTCGAMTANTDDGMPQIMMLQRWLLGAAFGTLACLCAGLAAAQPADVPSDEPSEEDVFEGPVDFSLPPPTGHPIDASRFTATANKGWDGKIDADSGDRTSGAA